MYVIYIIKQSNEKELNQSSNSEATNLNTVDSDYSSILQNKKFLAITLGVLFVVAIVLVYLAYSGSGNFRCTFKQY